MLRLLWQEPGAGEMLDWDPVQSLLMIYSVTQPFLATSIFYKTEIPLAHINVPQDIVYRIWSEGEGGELLI